MPMAAATIVSIPVILCLFTRHTFIQGINFMGPKG
jgi:hypothetical protein